MNKYIQESLETLDSLKELKFGWATETGDELYGQPVDRKLIVEIKNYFLHNHPMSLPIPLIAPTEFGGISLEYWKENKLISLCEIHKNGSMFKCKMYIISEKSITRKKVIEKYVKVDYMIEQASIFKKTIELDFHKDIKLFQQIVLELYNNF